MTSDGYTHEEAREALARRFRWVGGHADVWRLFDDGPTFTVICESLAEPWTDAGLTKVCGIEARGFILGGAVALRLGVGFVAVRKGDNMFPGEKATVEAAPDYRGLPWRLRIRTDSLRPGDRVVLVDDWAERGSQALAARQLVETCGAAFLGVSLVVDQLTDEVRSRLGRVNAIARSHELPPSA